MILDYFDLLTGDPVLLKGVGHIKSPLLKNVCPYEGIGYDVYNLYLHLMSWTKDELIDFYTARKIRKAEKLKDDRLKAFDVATLLTVPRKYFEEVISFFLLEDVRWDESVNAYAVYKNNSDKEEVCGYIHRENFETVRKAILNANYICLNDDEKEPVFMSDKAKELWAKKLEAEEEQRKAMSKIKDSKYNIANIVSKLCVVHPSYNLINIKELTIFQIYDAFFQVCHMRACELSEQIFSTHGGDKFDFEQWLKPINKNI